MAATDRLADDDFNGLAFINLVDYDMVYGHRNNAVGYAQALNEFDRWLGGFVPKMRDEDLLIITADHGCDPGDVSTDHTREYVPMLVYGSAVDPVNLGVRQSFSDIAASVCEYLGVSYTTEGISFLKEIISRENSLYKQNEENHE